MFILRDLDGKIARMCTVRDGVTHTITFLNDNIGRIRLDRFCSVNYDHEADPRYDHGDIVIFEGKYYTPSETCRKGHVCKLDAITAELAIQWDEVTISQQELNHRSLLRCTIFDAWKNEDINLFDNQ